MKKHKTLLFRASLPLCKKENVGTPHTEKSIALNEAI